MFLCAAAAPVAAKKSGLGSAECLACHGDIGLSKTVNGKQISLAVDEQKFRASIHGQLFQCTDCHKDIKNAPHDPAPEPVKCASCHEGEQKAYNTSVHANALKAGISQAASCVDCHGGPHEILPAGDPGSKVNHHNIPGTCSACHSLQFVVAAGGINTQPAISYQQSVHGRAVAAGSMNAAVCTDCHGGHDIQNPGNPQSSITKFNVPKTCAKCHANIQAQYAESVHGKAIEHGNWQAPVCTDCHGIHLIKAHLDPTSPVSDQQLAQTTCARCHESVRLGQEFGVSGGRASSYLSSYHGLANQRGSRVAANCASCHGVHNILPSSDARSSINQANLKQTCGKCHPGATDNFIKGKIHLGPQSADVGSVAVRFVRKGYIALILLTALFMALHNFLCWRRKALMKKGQTGRILVRMEPVQRWQHLFLLSSFIILVLTGFALTYPRSWLSAILPLPEAARGIVHRIAGVVLIGVSVFHVAYLCVNRGGRRLFLDMVPKMKDWNDFVGTMMYNLGRREEKPKYARFHYGQKFEYWALIWGTIVMAVTGLALWFKVGVAHLAPRWVLDVATAIHFYEAIMATMAIVLWHFYEVFFNPDVYPMNWAWYDGRMSLQHYAEEHGEDRETINAALEAMERQDAAHPPEEKATPAKQGK